MLVVDFQNIEFRTRHSRGNPSMHTCMYMGDRPEIPPPLHHPSNPFPISTISSYSLFPVSNSVLHLPPSSYIQSTFYNLELLSLFCTIPMSNLHPLLHIYILQSQATLSFLYQTMSRVHPLPHI
jgi:hypothetical protein